MTTPAPAMTPRHPKSTAAPEASTAAPGATAAPGGGGEDFSGETITVSGSETGTEAEGSVAGFAPFEATGATVDYQGSRDFETQIRVADEGDSLPDIALFPQPGDLKAFVDKVRRSAGRPRRDAADRLRPDLVRARHRRRQGHRRADQGRREEPRVVLAEGLRGERLRDPDDLGRADRPAGPDQGRRHRARGASASSRATPRAGRFTDWMEDIMLRVHGPEVYDQWVIERDRRSTTRRSRKSPRWSVTSGSTTATCSAAAASIASTGFGASPVGLVPTATCVHAPPGQLLRRQLHGRAARRHVRPGRRRSTSSTCRPSATSSARSCSSGGNYAVAFNDTPETVAVHEAPGVAGVRQRPHRGEARAGSCRRTRHRHVALRRRARADACRAPDVESTPCASTPPT